MTWRTVCLGIWLGLQGRERESAHWEGVCTRLDTDGLKQLYKLVEF